MKAIETAYRETWFKSRTEARWAVFFDHIGLRWEYEREGYVVGGEPYLPDFWLPDLQAFFEVKGKAPIDREWRVAQALADESGFPVYLAWGGLGAPLTADENCARFSPSSKVADLGQLWCTCPDCGRVALAPMGNGNAICGLDGPPKFTADAAALNHAYSAARRQVFWKPGGVSC